MLLLSVNLSIASETAKIEEDAPLFTLKDAYGKIHNLSDYEGSWVILEWISFDCPFVKKHYSKGNMQSLQQKYTDQDVVWLSICSSAEGKQGNFANKEIINRISSLKANMSAYLIDESGKVGKMYEAKTTPHMYIIDPDGKLIYMGAIDDTRSANPEDIKTSKNYITEVMDAVLNGEDAPIKTSVPYGCSVKYK